MDSAGEFVYRVNALDGKLVKKWHLNTLKEPAAGADSYQTTAGGSTLFGKSLLPTGATIAKQAVHEGRNGALSSWRLDIAAPVGNKVDHFLNVLEAAPTRTRVPGQTGASPVVPIRTGRSSLMGAQIGNQAVIFDVSPGQTITYQTNLLPALEHFILDQAPRKWYQVAVQSAKGDLLQQQRVQASDQGVLTFPITRVPTEGGWGGRTITISPAAPTCGGYPPASITTARHQAGGRALKPRKQSPGTHRRWVRRAGG